jgi:hypothetical protein
VIPVRHLGTDNLGRGVAIIISAEDKVYVMLEDVTDYWDCKSKTSVSTRTANETAV